MFFIVCIIILATIIVKRKQHKKKQRPNLHNTPCSDSIEAPYEEIEPKNNIFPSIPMFENASYAKPNSHVALTPIQLSLPQQEPVYAEPHLAEVRERMNITPNDAYQCHKNKHVPDKEAPNINRDNQKLTSGAYYPHNTSINRKTPAADSVTVQELHTPTRPTCPPNQASNNKGTHPSPPLVYESERIIINNE